MGSKNDKCLNESGDACEFATTYLFLDSSKTTKSTQVYGPEPAVHYLLTQRKLLMPIIVKFRGVVVDICWDSIMAKFETPLGAVMAALEIKDCYRTHPEFVDISQKFKIDLSGIGLSSDKHVAEELGENHTENGTIALHGDIVDVVKDKIFLYGIEFTKFTAKIKDHENDPYVSVERASMKEAIEWKDKIVMTVAPISMSNEEQVKKIANLHGAQRMEYMEAWLWFFDSPQDALAASEDIYKAYAKNITVALSFGDKTIIHESMKITSSYGVNSACKLAQDVETGNPYGIRITEGVFKTSPREGAYVLKDAHSIGAKFWDLIQ